MSDEKTYFFDKPQNIKLVLRIFYALCIVLLVLDFVLSRYIYHAWEQLPGFYPIYGFVGCVILVIVAKWMRIFLMRSEFYYDDKVEQSQESSASEGKHDDS